MMRIMYDHKDAYYVRPQRCILRMIAGTSCEVGFVCDIWPRVCSVLCTIVSYIYMLLSNTTMGCPNGPGH